MEKLNLKNAAAFGNAAFTRLDRAEALYEELVDDSMRSAKTSQSASNRRSVSLMHSLKQHKRTSDDATVIASQRKLS